MKVGRWNEGNESIVEKKGGELQGAKGKKIKVVFSGYSREKVKGKKDAKGLRGEKKKDKYLGGATRQEKKDNLNKKKKKLVKVRWKGFQPRRISRRI